MKSRLLRAGFALAFLLGQVGTVGVASAAPKLPNYEPVDISADVRGWEPTASHIDRSTAPGSAEEIQAGEDAALAAVAGTPYADCATDAKYWLGLDDADGFLLC